ncbi:LysR family transcriptional regulator [Ramlibacter sp. AW1]|uniref:LysR family transcriptional regulator n=1 Tax=Ramlibacter aurantiacus TaxID=2801330 RepID=A0A936ZLT2_9BURK|nr:LysR family transcriptional regulator [Ramlibacter aurantiacus]MBL0419643.1 LysR family transcriptional regulator [Ramlibacter aurantiacus]
MDRFTELALFVQVADKLSLSAAAEAMGLSRPAATRHLAALESRLNVRLVERSTRRLYLTGEGQEFVERARQVLAELQDAESTLHRSAASPSGLLRVGASLSFAMQVIAPRLPEYHRRYPQVRVHLETANRYLDIIDEGIDVAIRTREWEPDSSITIRRLAATRRVLAASPGYLAARGRPSSPADLRGHDLLVYVHANNPHELKFARGSDRQTVSAPGLLESNDGQVLRAAALNGLGILIQPSYILYEDIVAGRLVPVLDDWELPRLQINISYPSRKHLSAKVRTFIDFMVSEFEQNQYEKRWTSRI